MDIDKINESIEADEEARRIAALIDLAVGSDEQMTERRKAAGMRMAQNPAWREAVAKAAVKRNQSQNPKWREAIAKANAKLEKDPGWREAYKKGREKMYQSIEWKETMAKLPQNPVWREANAKAQEKKAVAVVCIETGVVYQGSNAAQRQTGIRQPDISSVCRGRRKTAGGYHWRYATPEEIAEFRAKQEQVES